MRKHLALLALALVAVPRIAKGDGVPLVVISSGVVYGSPQRTAVTDVTNLWYDKSASTLHISTASIGNMAISSTTVSTFTLTGPLIVGGTAGTSGYVLQSNGSGVAPSWITSPLILLSSTNTWTGQNTFRNQVAVSSNVVVTVGSFQGSGAGLTAIPAAQLTGTVPNASLDTSSITKQGNTFNGASQLVQMTSGALLPAVSGVNLTNLNASALASGTIPAARNDASTVTLQGNSFNGSTQLVQTTGAGALPTLSAANLTSIPAAQISGQVPAANLSNAILLQNTLQSGATFYVASGTVSGTMTAGTFSGSGASLTSIPAASIASGSLGSQVIASSIAVNAVADGSIVSMTSSKLTGTIANARLDPSSVTLQGNAFNGASQLVQMNSSTQLPAVSAVNLTHVTAANIDAGSLGASVIASSIAVNGVAPSALQSGVYSNITGLGTQGQNLAMGGFRVTGSSTTSSDAATTLATKGYVDTATATVAPSTLLSSTNTWTAQQTFTKLVTVSSDIIVNNGGTVTAGTFSGNATSATSATTATTATSATNIAAGVAGAIPYQSNPGATGFSAAGSSGQFFKSGGTGTPTWGAISSTDLGGNAILNQATLQTGATFYVSSGTVANGLLVGGQITAGTGSNVITTGAGLVDATKLSGTIPNASIDKSSITAQGNTFNSGSNLLQLSGGLVPNANVDASSVTKQGNVFNGASQLLQLGTGALVPNANVDASSVTKQGNTFNTGSSLLQLSGGLVPNANVDASSITKQGNTFNGNSQLVQTTSGGLLPAISAANLTSIPGANVTGTVPSASIDTSSITKQGNTFNAASKLVQLDSSTKLPAVDGSQLTNLPSPSNLNASNLTSGTVPANVLLSSAMPSAIRLGRRPELVYISSTKVEVATNTTTSGQSCILFPDGIQRCVATVAGRTSDLSLFGSWGTNPQGGIRTAVGAVASNQTYAYYAVGSTATASTAYSVMADSVPPVTTNGAFLDSVYGANNYVYLGEATYGDNDGSTTGLILFGQTGNRTCYVNGGAHVAGRLVASTGGATSLTYTYVSGMGAGQIPPNVGLVTYQYQATPGTGARIVVYGDSGQNQALLFQYTPSLTYSTLEDQFQTYGPKGAFILGSSSGSIYIGLNCWTDTALVGAGPNPQF